MVLHLQLNWPIGDSFAKIANQFRFERLVMHDTHTYIVASVDFAPSAVETSGVSSEHCAREGHWTLYLCNHP